MKKDEMYLENLDEFINDENRVVTYKWLSRTLCVHCNIAKQMLYKFTQNEKKKKNDVTVTYFVSGVTKPDDSGSQVLKCSVVPEEKLDACKKSLAELTSCHVYSVQKCKLKDSNALFITDYEKLKENIFESNKYSSIQNEQAVLRSQEDLELLTLNTAVSAPEPDKKPANGTTHATTKPAGKKQPQSAIASMFSKTDASKKSGKEAAVKPKEEPVNETQSKGAAKGGKAKGGGMMSTFFTKQADTKPEASSDKKTDKKPDKKAEAKKPEVSSKPTQKKETKPAKKASPENKTSSASKSKKNTRQEDSDDDEVQGKSKRRRIKPDLFDSSSEEEEEDVDMEEDEAPIPPTPPPKEASPEPEPQREASPEVEVIKTEKPKKPSPVKESAAKGSNSGEHKRKRTRKQVKKTYMDKDGFMVTEKVWESDSTDASEAEEPPKKLAKEPAKPAAQSKNKKSPQKKPSPIKKGSGKQTSLMSFFKKS